MDHKNIRNTFFEFFKEKDHIILPSYSLIPENDSSLLFTAAGMVPFKSEFSGKTKPKYKRISTIQKCFRMDDIENVGYTLRHHTFFEMMGNFSFGDYFKKESIYWAYELLTERYKIDPDKLYYSCHPEDLEAEEVWLSLNIPSSKIVKLEDNFWGPAGLTGPCGPSTEIFYENFPCLNNNPNCKPGFECEICKQKERFIEIWNIVFTQYFKESDGKLSPLPQKNIDTGMGLERLARILQNKEDQYQTDLFLPIMNKIEEFSQVDNKIYKRIIADHLRGAVFLLSDGVVPSNEGRGYVLRKLIRRAIIYSKLINIKEGFTEHIVPVVEEIFKDIYDHITKRKEFIQKMLQTEENNFNKTIQKGIEFLSKIEDKYLDGKKLFFMYDTLGFPLELIVEFAQSQGFSLDLEGFNKEMEAQRQRSRKNTIDIKVFSVKDNYSTEFVGYENLEYDSKIIGIFKIQDGKLIKIDRISSEDVSTDVSIVLVTNQTPFYPEGGGQVGDQGKILSQNFSFKVIDTQKHVEGFILHIGTLESGEVKLNDEVYLLIDKKKRILTSINHTATHLLHSALRKVLGHHVYQSGSLVRDDKLRFDFTHFDNLTDQNLKDIESLVNEKILDSIDVIVQYKNLKDALDEGAMALFAEKYPDLVRTVKIGDFSYELCGGTHVKNTSQIGLFKIINNYSLQMGIKRIEAITSLFILEEFYRLYNIVNEVKLLTKQEENKILPFIQKIINNNKEISRKLRETKLKLFNEIVSQKIGNINLEVKKLEFNVEEEEDVIMLHDILKNIFKDRKDYVVFYYLPNKRIAIFHKDFKEDFYKLFPGNYKLLPFGSFIKAI